MYLCVGSTNFLLWGLLVGPSYFYIGVCFEVCEVSRPAPRAVLGDLASFVLVYYVTCICMVVIVRCVRSTDLHLLLCRWSLMLFNLYVVVCAGSADLLRGCVGGSLAHHLIIVFVVMCVRSTNVHLSLRRWASHASFYLL